MGDRGTADPCRNACKSPYPAALGAEQGPNHAESSNLLRNLAGSVANLRNSTTARPTFEFCPHSCGIAKFAWRRVPIELPMLRTGYGGHRKNCSPAISAVAACRSAAHSPFRPPYHVADQSTPRWPGEQRSLSGSGRNYRKHAPSPRLNGQEPRQAKGQTTT